MEDKDKQEWATTWHKRKPYLAHKKRLYSEREWDGIFCPVTLLFFHTLDTIQLWDNHRKVVDRHKYILFTLEFYLVRLRSYQVLPGNTTR